MPKAAILFSMLLLSSVLTNSYALTPGDLVLDDVKTPMTFDSEILDVDSDFFIENDFKRYLIFGTNTQDIDFLKNNSLYGIQSDTGFFYISVLSEQSASNLISQGYYVIEDSKLDFHLSDNIISDSSRIGEITGSSVAKKKYGASGNGTVIAIIDTGVDFSNPDIQHSVARDKINHPIMLDPDGQGIVLTNATFFAYIDKNDIIRNYSKPIPPDMTSSAYVNKDGVFLDVSQGGKGSKIPIYNSFFPQLGSSPIFEGILDKDMKIGNDNRNYIKSKSGVYHLGVIYQGGLQGPLARIQVVPVLVVDSFISGVYDTMIPDLSTSWEDYTRFDLKSGQKPNYDFDFTDEKPIVLGSGKEFLVYDSNNDGKNDYSAGTFGAQVLDVYGVIKNNVTDIDDSLKAINGTLLPALDSDGNFFGIMSDFMGHGTSSAASITSRGQEIYDIYNNTKKHTIVGVAPDAKIVPVKALWFGDTVYGWLWSAGFENKDHTWKFSGKPKVDIISNSWGVSNFPSFSASPGMDVLSLILSVLVTPHSLDDDYPGITIISSAGNSGHGYGTIGLPNASPFGISVGATTNNIFVGYGPFKDQPRFGNTTTHRDQVVDFSSRGPGSIGDPKPDIMSIGAHGFTPSNVIKIKKDSKDESFSLFGGTSMAAPLVSGSAAILMEEMRKQSQDYDPFLIKNILMSTATDLQNDPFTQGSGLVNVESALNYVHGNDGVFIVYNDASYDNIKKILEPAIENINSTAIGFDQFQLSSNSLPMTSWFGGQLNPGDRTTATFTIKNPTNDTLSINVKSQTLSLITKNQFDGKTVVRQQDSILNKTDTFIPNYVRLSDVTNHETIGDFFNEQNPIPDESSLMIVNVNFPFSDFMNSTSDVYADDLKISSLYLYDWIDNNNDTKITSDELSMVNRAGSWGTVQELRISEPHEKFEGVPLVGVYPVPTRYSYWLGDTKQNSTSMDYTISASYYKKDNWSMLWPESEMISVPPKDSATINVTLITPNDLQTGVYQGFLTFESDRHTVNAPVSFVIKQPVTENETTILIQGKQSDDVLYGNGYTKGAFDMVNRYMAGDWRQYYFDIQNESINSGAIELSWISDDTNLAVFVMDPSGKIIQTNVPSGVFGHFLKWPSLDWLGNSLFSQGGGFFPVKNKDDTSTVLFVPINQTGTYTLLTHSTLFGGNSTTEPITLAAKFTNISPEMLSYNEQIQIESESMISDLKDNATTPVKIPETTIRDKSDLSLESDSSFSAGIAIGVVIGIAIGILFIFINRQKPPK
ncbi:S8 family serine peptidase [Nitrosopumilus ureiphilus]|uniref:Peptidase S8 n=1 Tax=Nitrosopumilus ureiphilus TaxID=1470067 RepID=A0A7D5M570_9ARCH|nr:S8 family serine peptidase [Nitrosopumilus ureiphilus]QLH07594.1 peptidase S8 [Nitrosopumilus ureiphilus]